MCILKWHYMALKSLTVCKKKIQDACWDDTGVYQDALWNGTCLKYHPTLYPDLFT